MIQQTGAEQILHTRSEVVGVTLQEHLSAIVAHLVEHQPPDPLSQLAHVSATVTTNHLHMREHATRMGPDVTSIAKSVELFKPVKRRVDRNGKLLDPIDKREFYVPNIIAESEMLEWAGVGFSREEAFKVCLAVQKLATDNKDLSSVRFFGRIQGTKRDYFIAEGESSVKDPPEHRDKKPWDPLRRDVEKMVHHNKFKYFVCPFPGAPWTKLPNVTYSQVLAASSIRKYFSGDLNAKISSYPPFPGNEANYLRAQLAHISAATVLSPDGYFTVTEADEETGAEAAVVREAEPPAMEDLSALAEVSAWKRHYPGIPEADVLPEIEAPEEGEEPEEPEPPEPTALEIRDAGDETPVVARLVSARYESFCPIALRHVLWPGAHSVALGGNFCNVYVGTGHGRLPTAFVLPRPPVICSEVEETMEQDDLKEQLDLGPPDGEEAPPAEEGGEEED